MTFQHNGRNVRRTLDAAPADEQFALVQAKNQAGKTVTVCFTGKAAEALQTVKLPATDALLSAIELPRIIEGTIWDGTAMRVLTAAKADAEALVKTLGETGFSAGKVLTAETTERNREIAGRVFDSLVKLQAMMKARDAEHGSSPGTLPDDVDRALRRAQADRDAGAALENQIGAQWQQPCSERQPDTTDTQPIRSAADVEEAARRLWKR